MKTSIRIFFLSFLFIFRHETKISELHFFKHVLFKEFVTTDILTYEFDTQINIIHSVKTIK